MDVIIRRLKPEELENSGVSFAKKRVSELSESTCFLVEL